MCLFGSVEQKFNHYLNRSIWSLSICNSCSVPGAAHCYMAQASVEHAGILSFLLPWAVQICFAWKIRWDNEIFAAPWWGGRCRMGLMQSCSCHHVGNKCHVLRMEPFIRRWGLLLWIEAEQPPKKTMGSCMAVQGKAWPEVIMCPWHELCMTHWSTVLISLLLGHQNRSG